MNRAVMANVTVTREQKAMEGRYVGRVEGFAGEAELTYSRANPAVVIANHTGTPVSLRGQGVATALVERLIADARSEGFRIVPLCSFVEAQFDRHPEWADLRATNLERRRDVERPTSSITDNQSFPTDNEN